MSDLFNNVTSKIISKRFSIFVFCGFSAFLIDLGILNIVRFVIYDGDDPLLFGVIYLAKLVSSVISITVGFFLNRFLAFHDTNERLRNNITKFILVNIFNVFWANFLFSLFYGILDLSGLNIRIATNLANVLTEGVKMITSFLMYKILVFRVK